MRTSENYNFPPNESILCRFFGLVLFALIKSHYLNRGRLRAPASDKCCSIQMDFPYSPTLLNRPESAFVRPINTSNSQEKIKGPLQHWFGFCYESCTQSFHGMMVPAQWWLSIAKLLGPGAKLKFSELLILANFLINPSWYTAIARVVYICHNKPPIIRHISVQRMLRTSYCSAHPTAQAEYTSFSIIQC